MPLKMDTKALEARLGYSFNNTDILRQALTHRSHSSVHNERLEFLGDSVLNCVIAYLLFERFGKIDEGDLSRLRANLVKQQSLYDIAQRIDLSQYLRLGEGELKSGGFRRPSILADTLEAIFGAIFLDSGFDSAEKIIRSLYDSVLDNVDPKTLGKDAKTLLQEYLQGKKIALPQYNVIATHGAAHSQEFEVECLVPKLDIQVFGGGGSRRAAEQDAARHALDAVQLALAKMPAAAKKSRPRTTQLKLAGIATIQPEPRSANPEPAKSAVKPEPAKTAARAEHKKIPPAKSEEPAQAAGAVSKNTQGKNPGKTADLLSEAEDADSGSKANQSKSA